MIESVHDEVNLRTRDWRESAHQSGVCREQLDAVLLEGFVSIPKGPRDVLSDPIRPVLLALPNHLCGECETNDSDRQRNQSRLAQQ